MSTTHKPSTSKRKPANLRVCASCEWIFRLSDPMPPEKLEAGFTQGSCPQCGFASYGARYVYEGKAYRYSFSQEPWLRNKMATHESKLLDQIEKENPIKPKTKPRNWLRNWQNMGQENPDHI